MSIIKLNPFRNDIFSWGRQPFFEDVEDWPELTMTQGLNIHEEDDKVVVKAVVPGIPEDKLYITYEDGILHIRGSVQETKEEKEKKKVVYRKQMISSVDYTTYLPRAIDSGKIDAEVKNGILTIKATVAEEARPKRIVVKTSAKK